jgi:hypothetical protein
LATIYLDESGDLGWNFQAPYRAGGSSRYLTIAAVFAPDTHAHHPARVIRDMYTERGWSTAKEKKWSDMSDGARLDFATKAAKLVQRQPEIKYFAMVVNKQKVLPHLRADPNLLYNYMLRLLLIDEMALHNEILLVPDPRSIKVASGNSQHEYLQTYLWYDKGAATKLLSRPVDSKKALGIQFADMVSGVVQAHHEDNRTKPWAAMASSVQLKTLFF